MGTRASFWIGDPRDLENRKWLGCIAYDGYPDGVAQELLKAKTQEQFIEILKNICNGREDFSSPEKGWPFPWDDNIFLTDYTYAFFEGETQVAYFSNGFAPLDDYFKFYNKGGECFFDQDILCKKLSHNVPAPKQYDSTQPDSIIML